VSDYDDVAREMAARHARSALKQPKRLLVTVDIARSEAEITELDKRAGKPIGTPKRIPLDPEQIRRLRGG
jgi:hypothetical protein